MDYLIKNINCNLKYFLKQNLKKKNKSKIKNILHTKKIFSHNKTLKPIFIVGLNESGTTLLRTIILNSFDLGGTKVEMQADNENLAPSEFHYPFSFCFSERKVFSSPKFMSKYYLDEKNYSKNKEKIFENYLNELFLKYKKENILLKNPINTLKINYLRKLNSNSKFIAIYRNGYSVVDSIVKMRTRTNLPSSKITPKKYNKYIIEDAALHWLFGNKILFNEYKKKDILFIKFEDLILDTENKLDQISNFLMLKKKNNQNLSIDKTKVLVKPKYILDNDLKFINKIISKFNSSLGYKILE